MIFPAALLTVGVTAAVVVLQNSEKSPPSAKRNLLLICCALLTGVVAAGLAIAFDMSGRWGNWEDNMPWMLGIGSFALLMWALKGRGSEVIILWWAESLSFLTTYGTWENGPGDEGLGALLTAIMSFGATAFMVVLIGVIVVDHFASK